MRMRVFDKQGRHGQFLADKASTVAATLLSILQNPGKA